GGVGEAPAASLRVEHGGGVEHGPSRAQREGHAGGATARGSARRRASTLRSSSSSPWTAEQNALVRRQSTPCSRRWTPSRESAAGSSRERCTMLDSRHTRPPLPAAASSPAQ